VVLASALCKVGGGENSCISMDEVHSTVTMAPLANLSLTLPVGGLFDLSSVIYGLLMENDPVPDIFFSFVNTAYSTFGIAKQQQQQQQQNKKN